MASYEQERRTSRQRGYDARWEKASRLFRREHPLCCGCEAMGLVEPAMLVDHVIPHQDDQIKFWDQANWQPACEWHHNAVKAVLERLWLEGAIATSSLRLDSAVAVGLSRRTPRKPAITGTDGWPRG